MDINEIADELQGHADRARESAEKHAAGEMEYAPDTVRRMELEYPGIKLSTPEDNGYWMLIADVYESAATLVREA